MLKNVKLGDQITLIGDYAFYNSGLESIEIKHFHSVVESRLFCGKTQFGSFEIPYSVQKINGKDIENL